MPTTLKPLDTAPLNSMLHLIAELAVLGGRQTLLQLGLWRLIRQRRHGFQRRLHHLQTHRAHETDPAQALDPDDVLTDNLLAIQEGIKNTLHKLQAIPRKSWIEQRIRQELIRLHTTLGALRLWIMEHDADCSPVLPGSFDSAESLLAALEKDAA